jgi:hypothetical protein
MTYTHVHYVWRTWFHSLILLNIRSSFCPVHFSQTFITKGALYFEIELTYRPVWPCITILLKVVLNTIKPKPTKLFVTYHSPCCVCHKPGLRFPVSYNVCHGCFVKMRGDRLWSSFCPVHFSQTFITKGALYFEIELTYRPVWPCIICSYQ